MKFMSPQCRHLSFSNRPTSSFVRSNVVNFHGHFSDYCQNRFYEESPSEYVGDGVAVKVTLSFFLQHIKFA